MELHAQRLPLPLSDAALLTSVVLQTLGKQATLQMGPIRPSSDDEQCVEGKQTGARRDVTSPHSVSPRLRGKTKPPPAFTHRHAGLVHTADLAPIEAASELSSRRNAELSSVVTHSRLRDTELPRDLGNPETLVEQVGNRPTALPGRALRSPWPRSDLAPADRRCPSGVGETEPALAFLGTVAGVVESPDGFPIVDLRPSLPSRKANPSSDAGNRLTRDFESPANFDLWNPLLKQPTNFPIPAIHRTDVRNQTGRNRRNEAGLKIARSSNSGARTRTSVSGSRGRRLSG